ncbi:MAG: D-glycero-beta-D-manno-heptose 1-phosphate adenylyltransferase [Planctomycetaceae bacterium]
MSTPKLQIHTPPIEPLERALNRTMAKRLRFLVIGDMVVDCYMHGSSRRLSREAPVPVVEVERDVKYPGAAANVVCNVRALGIDVAAASVIGVDRAGTVLRRILGDRGVCTSQLIGEPGRKTRVKERLIVRGQHIARFDRGAKTAVNLDSENRLFESIQSLDTVDAVLVCDHCEGVLSRRVLEWLMRWANRRGIPVLVDPEGDDATRYRGCTLIKPNREETLRLTGIDVTDEAEAQAAADRLRELTGARYVLITLDEAGLIAHGDSTFRIPTLAQDVREVSGAGDSLFATLAFGIAAGLSFQQATELSAAAAAIAVSQPGLSTITLQELLDALPRMPLSVVDGEAKVRATAVEPVQESSTPANSQARPTAAPLSTGQIISAADAEQISDRLRREGKRVVFTNGCFDLLHRGHVDYLAASRKLGDVLIVGVNSDASVKRLKGPERPVVDQAQRLHILSTLRSVDYVVLFDEETPVDLIRRVRPDVLTKGGDYLGQTVPGAEFAGQLHLIPFVDGCSTTLAIDRIRKAG